MKVLQRKEGQIKVLVVGESPILETLTLTHNKIHPFSSLIPLASLKQAVTKQLHPRTAPVAHANRPQ